jgi:hypothetical protein
MNIYALDTLKKDPSNNLYYDLTVSTFMYQKNYRLFVHTVEPHEEMRIDLICKAIYNNTTNVDVILDLNNIIMPLNIRAGDNLFYLDANDISFFRPVIKNLSDIKAQLANTNKRKRVDLNRIQANNQNITLAPNVNTSEIDQVRIVDTNIVIGEGVFK